MRKVAVSLADSVDLRIILSVLYIITEVIRSEIAAASEDYAIIGEAFKNELSELNKSIFDGSKNLIFSIFSKRFANRR